jgi:hypothetical protein
MRTSVKLGIALAVIGATAGLWFAVNRGNRALELDAHMRIVCPIEAARRAAAFDIDWSKWPRRKGGAQLMLANRGTPADVADRAAVEREREASGAMAHSLQSFYDLPGHLLVRVRVRTVDAAGRLVPDLRYGEPDDDGWVQMALPDWPIRCEWGLGTLARVEQGTTRVELEVVGGESPPLGTVPAIVVSGVWDPELLEGAMVGAATVDGAFVITLTLALFIALGTWANKRRAADIAAFPGIVDASIEARARESAAADSDVRRAR